MGNDRSGIGSTDFHILGLDNLSAAPTFPSDFYGICFVNGVVKQVLAGVVTAFSGSGGVSTWDELYTNDKTLTLDNATSLTFNLTHATADGLTLQAQSGSAGDVLQFANAGSGKDINGTSSTWSVSKAGAATFASIVGASLTSATNLTLDATGSGTITLAGTSTGAVTIGSTLVVTGAGGSAALTITAGDILGSDASLTLVDADNAASFSLTNNTITTATALATITSTSLTTGSALAITANGLTSGTLLHLETSDAGLTTGKYLNCYNGAASVFSISDEGVTVIAGAGGSAALTVTAGDIVGSDASLTLTDADNAASLSVTNNTATTASVFVFAGSGAFTGNTTSSFFTLTPSGLTTGTAFYLPAAALTTGKAIHVVGNAVTSGILVNITSSAGGTQLTGAGRLFSINHTGTATGSGILAEIITAAADETIAAQITASGLITGSLLKLDMSASAAGTGLLIAATEATLTTGKYIDCYDGAASDFTVSKYGATVIAGNAALTASLTLTAGDFVMSAGTFRLGTSATVTAHVGSSQGDGPITNSYVEIAVCANAGDAVTLPAAAAGRTVIITNHGAQAADVFPASGDAINEGTVDIATSCAVNETLLFIAYDATNWECVQLARNS